MVIPDVRQQLVSELKHLTDEQVAELLRYVETMQSFELPDDYDEDNDPSVGFFSAEPDFASRSEEILRAEFGQPRHGKKANE